MEVSLVIIVLLIVLTLIIFKRFSNFIYAFGIMDIFLRIIVFLRINIGVNTLSNFLKDYFPESIASLIRIYSNGLFETILIWAYVIFYIILEYYLFSYFLKKKK